MTAGTPIPAGVLTVDDEPNGIVYLTRWADTGVGFRFVTAEERARLLAGPARPDGVPDDAVPAGPEAWWIQQADGRWKLCAFNQTWTRAAYPAEFLRERGVPVPPYQPTPSCPACGSTSPDAFDQATQRHMCLNRQAHAHGLAEEMGDQPTPEHVCVCGHSRESHYEKYMGQLAGDDVSFCGRCRKMCEFTPAECDYCADGTVLVGDDLDEGLREPCDECCPNHRPANEHDDGHTPVNGACTGPLGLNEGDRVRHMTSGRIAAFVRYAPRGMMLVESIESGERIIYAPELWEPVRDAQPEPAETLDDIVADRRKLAAWKADALILLAQWEQVWEAAGRPGLLGSSKAASVREWIEAASQPDPDTITVNRDDLQRVLGWIGRMDGQDAGPYMSVLRLSRALAAAGLPQEPTATRPRPTLDEQRAHLDEGSCRCHDSWDQCPCAEGGHPADGSCGCCPLGTGLCGPLPQEPTEGGER